MALEVDRSFCIALLRAWKGRASVVKCNADARWFFYMLCVDEMILRAIIWTEFRLQIAGFIHGLLGTWLFLACLSCVVYLTETLFDVFVYQRPMPTWISV